MVAGSIKKKRRFNKRHGSERANQTTCGPVFISLRNWACARTIPSVHVRSEVGGKLQLRVNAEQRTVRWRFRIEVADKTVPGPDLDVTGGTVGAVNEHRTDRKSVV